MKVVALLRMSPDELLSACRHAGIKARSGTEALAMLAQKWGGDCGHVYLRDGQSAYRHSQAMRAFIRDFNSGLFPEIDDPDSRSLHIAQDTPQEQAESMANAMDALGDRVADRLTLAGCFGETPEDALTMWLRMYLCGDVVVRDGEALWLGTWYPLTRPLKEFVESWEKYPGLHFVIAKQLG